MKNVYIGIKRTISIILNAFLVVFVIMGAIITYKNIDPLYKTEGKINLFGAEIQAPDWLYGYETTDCLGVQPYVILSDSMKPTFSAGDGILAYVLEPADKYEVKVGDVVSYTIGDPMDRTIIIHRIDAIDQETGKLIFKGDNNNMVDAAEVSYDQLQAKYGVKIPGFGWILNKAKTIPGAIMIVLISVGIIYFWNKLWEILDTIILGKPEDEEDAEETPEDDASSCPDKLEPAESNTEPVEEGEVEDLPDPDLFEDVPNETQNETDETISETDDTHYVVTDDDKFETTDKPENLKDLDDIK